MRIHDLENKLRNHAKKAKSVMQAPFDLKEEIKNMERQAMKKHRNRRMIKRTVAVAVVFALCIITFTMMPLANSLKGFFKDIIRFDGAITGTKYENATNDIKIDVLELTFDNGNTIIPLELTFKNPTEAPFRCIQEVAICEYKIMDSKNKVIAKSKLSVEEGEKGIVKNGEVLVNLLVNDKDMILGEEYTILIEKMYGLAKADAPLHITGVWECKFVK